MRTARSLALWSLVSVSWAAAELFVHRSISTHNWMVFGLAGALRLLAMVVTSHAMLPTDVEASGLNHPANILPPILGFLHSSAVLCIQRVNTVTISSLYDQRRWEAEDTM